MDKYLNGLHTDNNHCCPNLTNSNCFTILHISLHLITKIYVKLVIKNTSRVCTNDIITKHQVVIYDVCLLTQVPIWVALVKQTLANLSSILGLCIYACSDTY